MKLEKLLEGIEYTIERGSGDTDILELQYDSRKVKEKGLFICIEGFNADGHRYAEAALEKGAAAIICEKDIEISKPCTLVKVKNSRKALAVAAANYYGRPAEKIKIIGITGTNGKTTSTFMIKSIFEKAGFKVGLVGTIANYIGQRKIPAHRTTPESLELQKLFKEMKDEGVDYCIMEVSSHSLALDRVYGVEFACGIFSNLTRDHLDFHKTFEDYFKAKYTLFQHSGCSIVNADDEYGRRIAYNIGNEVITYGIKEKSDVQAEDVNIHPRGVDFRIDFRGESFPVKIKIPGSYNVYNALCAAAVSLRQNIGPENIASGLKEVWVPGRCELVTESCDLGFEIIIDYAHSPDSLENILKTLREFTNGRLIAVFGCGGDRDKTKRPIMGRIGTELSDVAIITSDNPRSEEPEAIIADIVKGLPEDKYEIIENRREAIKEAISIAKPGDIILVAGKGHEDYQELKQGIIPFDERVIIKEILKEQNLLAGEAND